MNIPDMFVFVSHGEFKIKYRGTSYVVKNPVECEDFSHLIGQQVQIDDLLHKVIGVERFLHSPLWREGEDIALLVDVR